MVNLTGWPAKASCTSAIAAARDFVADVGAKAAQTSGGLLDIARCSSANPERDCRRVLVNKDELSLGVKRSQLGKFPHIPILRIRDWFEFLASNSCMHILHGLQKQHASREESILSAFWRNFARLYPNHQIFQQASLGTLVLKRAIPLLLHGDEGRGRRHGAHFVFSFHSMLGRGFAKANQSSRGRGLKNSWARMEVNFEGHTFTNRFLITSLRKRDYSDEHAETWQLLMESVAEEARFMWEVGVANPQGGRFWGVVVGIIGDWPFLHKCAGFSRSFNNIQKRVTVRTPPVGICHRCQAGQTQCPFEQIETRRPTWAATEHVQNTFLTPSPFATHLLHEPGKEASIWCYDWFHAMHLGVLKHYLGSVLALLSEEEAHGQIDERFAALSQDFKSWCHRNSRRAFVSKISKESISWETTSTYPTGSWHKGALSTVLMEYVEARFNRDSFPHQPLLGLAAEACHAIQRCSRLLYRSSLWLEPGECKLVAELGFLFLRRYSQMATMAKQMRRCLFIFQPKIHLLHHFMVDLHQAHQRGVCGVNPLGTSCQPSEDFIGRPARLSRRVTAQTPVLHRIMDRYLQSAYHHFIKAKYLIR